jgi:hypothetical protein
MAQVHILLTSRVSQLQVETIFKKRFFTHQKIKTCHVIWRDDSFLLSAEKAVVNGKFWNTDQSHTKPHQQLGD